MNWDWEKLKKEHDKEKDEPKSKKKKRPKFNWIMAIVSIIMGIIVVISLWLFGRWAQYTLSYKSKVQQEIIEMVKPGALKDKYKNSIKKKLLIDE